MADLSEDQAAVYDRQLRVWGVEVQRRLSEGRVLIVGSGGLAAEVAKNIVLAGVGNVTLLDDAPAPQQNKAGNFLVPANSSADTSAVEASAKTLAAMNPYVSVAAATAPAASAAADPALLSQHQLVVLAAPAASLQLQQDLDAACRGCGVKCMVAAARGPLSFLFLDLLEHAYRVKPEDAAKPEEAGEHVVRYHSLQQALAVTGPKLRGCHPLYAVLKVVAAFEEQHSRPPTPADLPHLQALAPQVLAAPTAGTATPAAAAAPAPPPRWTRTYCPAGWVTWMSARRWRRWWAEWSATRW